MEIDPTVQAYSDWESQPHIAALIADLKEKHPDYDNGMIYQMAWMRSQKVEEV